MRESVQTPALNETEKAVGPPSGDVVDAGARGKEFEAAFVKGLKVLGLDFETNRATGAVWDIRPTGPGWHRLIRNRDTNLKVHSTRWLFSDRSTYLAAEKAAKMVRKGTLTPEQADKRVENALRRAMSKKEVWAASFMKPRSGEVQRGIVKAAKANDEEKLRDLLRAQNFATKRFGRSYTVSVDINWKADDWKDTGYVRIDGGTGKKTIGSTGRIREMGGVLTFAFRDRSAAAKKPHHAARVSEERASRCGSVAVSNPSHPSRKKKRKRKTDEEDMLYNPSLTTAVKRHGFKDVEAAKAAAQAARDLKRAKKLPKRIRRALLGPRDGNGELLFDRSRKTEASIAEAVTATWDTLPYSNMRLQDVARLFDGATRTANPNPAVIMRIINRFIGALEFSAMATIGRPEANRMSKMLRGSLDRLADRITLKESCEIEQPLARLRMALELIERRGEWLFHTTSFDALPKIVRTSALHGGDMGLVSFSEFPIYPDIAGGGSGGISGEDVTMVFHKQAIRSRGVQRVEYTRAWYDRHPTEGQYVAGPSWEMMTDLEPYIQDVLYDENTPGYDAEDVEYYEETGDVPDWADEAATHEAGFDIFLMNKGEREWLGEGPIRFKAGDLDRVLVKNRALVPRVRALMKGLLPPEKVMALST